MSGWKTSPAPGTPPDDAQSRSFARGHGTQRRVPEPGPTYCVCPRHRQRQGRRRARARRLWDLLMYLILAAWR